MGQDSAGASTDEPLLVFASRNRVTLAIDVRVNFGIFAGRTVTSAEIDRLAQSLLDEIETVTILSEERYEISRGAEASAHQVRIEIPESDVPKPGTDARARLETWVIERVGDWVRTCIAERQPET